MLIRTNCHTCNVELFWGSDSPHEPECKDCREIREAAEETPPLLDSDEDLYRQVPTLRPAIHLSH